MTMYRFRRFLYAILASIFIQTALREKRQRMEKRHNRFHNILIQQWRDSKTGISKYPY